VKLLQCTAESYPAENIHVAAWGGGRAVEEKAFKGEVKKY